MLVKKFSQTWLGRLCPESVLKGGRFLLQQHERQRVFREINIRKEQDALIQKQFDSRARGLVVYLVDGADWVTGKEKISGGLLSIASMYEEARKLPELASYQVMMAVLDSTPLILRHTEFENDITVYRLSQVFTYFKQLRHLIINVPEMHTATIAKELRRVPSARLRMIQNLHVNILNQNNQKMPGPEAVDELRKLVPQITMCIGHARSCTVEVSKRYRIPLHFISTRCSPNYYRRRSFVDKIDLLTASHDPQPLKQAVLENLEKQFPELQVQVIRGFTYSRYKATIEKAKWGITFGEGLDWYFLEMVFSGGISFTVFNEEFFPDEYKVLPTLFSSYEHMLRDLPATIRRLNNPQAYAECHNQLFDFLKKHHRYEEYLQKMREFYQGKYDIPF